MLKLDLLMLSIGVGTHFRWCGLIRAKDTVVVRSASSLRSIDRVAVLIESKVERREEEEEGKKRTMRFK